MTATVPELATGDHVRFRDAAGEDQTGEVLQFVTLLVGGQGIAAAEVQVGWNVRIVRVERLRRVED